MAFHGAGKVIFKPEILPKMIMELKPITALEKSKAVKGAKSTMKNVKSYLSKKSWNPKNMFGGLNNAAPKVPNNVPNSAISQGSKIPINKGTSSKLAERGMDLQLFAHKKGSADVVENAIKGAAKVVDP
ncbi:hypothetical protein [Clostridium sp. UBA6640]|uniref:hypothetical protein n=1 Tax=Clostridium sp. UBA6640 TaxID=1946370 RepID=UPI0025B8FC47|nr:hypothetical protein [Clostridium sp. UBA6640]